MSDFSEENTTTDILDATQNAVIDAVNSVTEILEKTTSESTIADPLKAEPFYQGAEFWVGMSFVLVVVFLAYPASKMLKKILNKYRESVVKDLEDAAEIHAQAQKLFADYERRFLNTDQEVKQIIEAAEEKLTSNTKMQKRLLEAELTKKKKEAENIIETATDKVRSETNQAICEKTIQIVKQRLQTELTDKQRSKLIDKSITNILKSL